MVLQKDRRVPLLLRASSQRANTFEWYEKRCYPLPDDYDVTDWEGAIKVTSEWEGKIPIGFIYENDRKTYEDHFPLLNQGPLVFRDVDQAVIEKIMDGYR